MKGSHPPPPDDKDEGGGGVVTAPKSPLGSFPCGRGGGGGGRGADSLAIPDGVKELPI